MRDFSNFYKIANDLQNGLNKIADSKQLNVGVLAGKLNKAAEVYPTDMTIVNMSRIFDRLATRSESISINEFKKIAAGCYSNYSKFEDLFANELGIKQSEEKPAAIEKKASGPVNISDFTNPLLVALFERTVDKNVKLPTYNVKTASKAENMVGYVLDSLNLSTNKIKVSCGNNDYLLVEAGYETPKGITSILIPVEVLNDKVSVAGGFIGNKGAVKLAHTELKNYILENSGIGLKVAATDILNSMIKNAGVENLNEVEIAAIKLKTKTASVPGIYVEATEDIVDNTIKTPEISEEFKNFSEQLNSVAGMAEFKFGKDLVKSAANVVYNKLNNLGYRNSQIKIANLTDKSVIFAVKVAGLAFTTTVKFENKKVLNPNYIVANSDIISFDKIGLSKLANENNYDYKAAATANSMNSLNDGDLVENVRAAINEGNLAKAEDTLNVLAHKNNKIAYLNAFEIYSKALSNNENGKVATANCYTHCACDKQIKVSTSMYPVCAHLNLPINKVYTDKHGNCRPLYRRGQEDSTSEVMQTIHHKLFG